MPIFQEHWGLPLPAHTACSFTLRSYHSGRYNSQLCNGHFFSKIVFLRDCQPLGEQEPC